MDAFESVIALLLRQEGYWVIPSFKVEITREEKRKIGRPSSPRWEIDLVAYQGATNEVLAVECKSFLDSRGVIFYDGSLQPPERFKLFSDSTLREVVLVRLSQQLVSLKFCPPNHIVHLALATGKIASTTDKNELLQYFSQHDWKLFDDDWVQEKLKNLKLSRYENDPVYVAAKLALREKRRNKIMG